MMSNFKMALVTLASILLLVCCEKEPLPPTVPPPAAGDTVPEIVVPEGNLFTESFPEENDEIKYTPDGITFNRTLYVDAVAGDDSNDGLSPEGAIKSLDQLSQMSLTNGDEILLKGGQEHKGCIELNAFNSKAGSGSLTTHIGSYGTGKARLNFYGYPNGILLLNSSKVVVSDLKITGNGGPVDTGYMIRSSDKSKTYRQGIFVNSAGQVVKDITLYNIDMRDIYYYNKGDADIPAGRPCREWSTSGESHYGWGIRVTCSYGTGSIENLKVDYCNVHDVSHTGLKMNGTPNAPLKNISITNCTLFDTGGPGSQFSNMRNGYIAYCKTVRSGSRKVNEEPDNRKWGRGSGVWVIDCDGLLFEHNHYERAEGIADCCGAHIDIGNKNVIIQYCFSLDNCGGFVEVLGENQNCSYRYNISINDGWRNPKDAVQDAYWDWKDGTTTIGTNGCLVTVNGHTNNGYVGPYQTYIYNNTIVQTQEGNNPFTNPFIFEMATSAKGILMMNNLFWIPEKMNKSWSSHTVENGVFTNAAVDFRVTDGTLNANGGANVRDMTQEEIDALDFVVKNNLYKLYNKSYPDGSNALPDNSTIAGSEVHYWDENALGGNPYFSNPDGTLPENMIPRNAEVINRGMAIPKLSSDNTPFGLSPLQWEEAMGEPLGLAITEDFFGRPITTPIIGACVVQ